MTGQTLDALIVTEPGTIGRPTEGTTALRRVACFVVAPTAVVAAIVAVGRLADPTVTHWVRVVLVAGWALAGALVAARRGQSLTGPIALAASGFGAIALLAMSFEIGPLMRAMLGLLPATALHVLASLPDGHLGSRSERLTVGAAYIAGAVITAATPGRSSEPDWRVYFALWAAAILLGLHASHRIYLRAGAVDRRRMQWVGWALAVTAELVLALVALRLIADWPPRAAVVALLTTILIPVSLVAGASVKMIARVDRLLTHTVALAGLTALVIVTYLAVAISLGRSLHDGERSLLLLSMAAAVGAALIYAPLRARLTRSVNQLIYGERAAPDETLRTWGTRLTRAIPLDELMLQLAESLRKSLGLQAAEIYTGHHGQYDVAAGVPHRDAPTLRVADKEQAVVARVGVSGGTWLDVWLPSLAGANSANTRVAPIAHGGQLLGLIVLTRRPDGEQLTEDDDRMVTELARQLGLALHNVQLDSALQASLEELQRTNIELQQSRLRIVSAGDAERRKLERNLHDGAQQHLVAMAVKLRMVEELVEDDPVEAVNVIEQLRGDLKETIAELRALAHGIFPPLLSSGGLAEALPAAATRATLPTTVDTTDVGRYTPEIESTVYFCCLEALQNAAKHAGEDAQIAILVAERDGVLSFSVADDGVGFVPDDTEPRGHGFVNMRDRLGTIGASLSVTSSVGGGTTIRGEIPV